MSIFEANDPMSEIDSLGAELSLKVNCAIRYSAAIVNKPIFECHCGVAFPLYALQGARASGDWVHILEKHKGEAIKG